MINDRSTLWHITSLKYSVTSTKSIPWSTGLRDQWDYLTSFEFGLWESHLRERIISYHWWGI